MEKKKSLYDYLPPDIAAGARQYFRDYRAGKSSTPFTRHCATQYELLRLNTVPGVRDALNARQRRRYHEKKGEPR